MLPRRQILAQGCIRIAACFGQGAGQHQCLDRRRPLPLQPRQLLCSPRRIADRQQKAREISRQTDTTALRPPSAKYGQRVALSAQHQLGRCAHAGPIARRAIAQQAQRRLGLSPQQVRFSFHHCQIRRRCPPPPELLDDPLRALAVTKTQVHLDKQALDIPVIGILAECRPEFDASRHVVLPGKLLLGLCNTRSRTRAAST